MTLGSHKPTTAVFHVVMFHFLCYDIIHVQSNTGSTQVWRANRWYLSVAIFVMRSFFVYSAT